MNIIFRLYLKYLIWIAIAGFFGYIFQFIYSADGWNFFLTFFIAATLGLVLWATR